MRPADRGRHRARADLWEALEGLRRARLGSGLSLRAVAAATGIDHVRIWRFERHDATPSIEELAAIGGVVGQDVRLRVYPAGDPIRDAGQLRLLARLRQRLHPALHWATEVPLPLDRDLRAWDAVIQGESWMVHVEAETVIADVQALERRFNLKIRDAQAERIILLVADTPRNRRALAAAGTAGSLGGWPVASRPILGALGRGEPPAVNGIVLI